MELFLSILALAAGFVMLAKGADLFVDGAAGIATKLKIPQLVIGLTIVAMGTSAPEAAVSISAALQGNGAITVGNVVGSNILNILIILGISASITALAVSKSTIKIDIPVMLVATALLLIFGLDGTIVWWEGLLILISFALYLTYLFVDAKKNAKKEQSSQEKENDELEKKLQKPHFLLKSIIFAIIGLVLIILGSEFSVEAATRIAKIAGLSDRFIGLTVVALGTSLPELFTSVSAAIKKNADIAIGNIVGSNIFNILFIVGLTAIITPVTFESGFIIDTVIAFAAAVMLLLFSLKGSTLRRWSGIAMLLSYAGYFVYILI